MWLVICAFNMRRGVLRAGYAVGEEMPVFVLVFLLPAVLAVVDRRWYILFRHLNYKASPRSRWGAEGPSALDTVAA